MSEEQVKGLSLWLNFDMEGLSLSKGEMAVRRQEEGKKQLEATNRVKIRHLDIRLHKAQVRKDTRPVRK